MCVSFHGSLPKANIGDIWYDYGIIFSLKAIYNKGFKGGGLLGYQTIIQNKFSDKDKSKLSKVKLFYKGKIYVSN